MPDTGGLSDADRYGWPGASSGETSAAAARIARHLVRGNARAIGFLPTDDKIEQPERLAPLLKKIGETFLGFVSQDVAVIDAWKTWGWGDAEPLDGPAAHRLRWIVPRLMEIAPAACGDADAATVMLQNALAARPPSVGAVFVNLAGYAPPRTFPAAGELLDGVVLVVRRRTPQSAVRDLAARIPPDRRLGGILLG